MRRPTLIRVPFKGTAGVLTVPLRFNSAAGFAIGPNSDVDQVTVVTCGLDVPVSVGAPALGPWEGPFLLRCDAYAMPSGFLTAFPVVELLVYDELPPQFLARRAPKRAESSVLTVANAALTAVLEVPGYGRRLAACRVKATAAMSYTWAARYYIGHDLATSETDPAPLVAERALAAGETGVDIVEREFLETLVLNVKHGGAATTCSVRVTVADR